MTFPVVEDVVTSQESTSSDVLSVAMPATVNTDDLLLIFACSPAGNINPDPSGWTYILQDDIGGRWGVFILAKKADGSEGGTTVDLDWDSNFSTSERGVAHVYQISGWGGDVGTDVEVTLDSLVVGTTSDCPAHTASWGAKDTLWIPAVWGEQDFDVTGAPTNYTDLTSTNSGGGTTGINGATIGTARRELNTETEDPGSFTISVSDRTASSTLAVEPGSSGGGGGGTTVSVGLTTETDSAFGVSASKTASAGLATEAETAQPVTTAKAASVGQPQETNTAQSVDHSRAASVGLAIETDSAFGVASSGETVVPVGLSTETDTAFGVNYSRSASVAQAQETDAAFGLSARKTATVGQGAETSQAFTVTARKALSVAQPIEVGTAFAVSAAKSATVGLATETDSAFASVTLVGDVRAYENARNTVIVSSKRNNEVEFLTGPSNKIVSSKRNNEVEFLTGPSNKVEIT